MKNEYVVVLFASKYTLLLIPLEENSSILLTNIFSLY